MGIEYNECHYCGMYNVYVKRIFVITEIVHMNEKTGTGVNYMQEKVKESQSIKCATLARHLLRVPGWGHHTWCLIMGSNSTILSSGISVPSSGSRTTTHPQLIHSIMDRLKSPSELLKRH